MLVITTTTCCTHIHPTRFDKYLFIAGGIIIWVRGLARLHAT